MSTLVRWSYCDCRLHGGPFNGQTVRIRTRTGTAVVVTKFSQQAIRAKNWDAGCVYRSEKPWNGESVIDVFYQGTVEEQRA